MLFSSAFRFRFQIIFASFVPGLLEGFGKKERKTKTKNAERVVLMAGASRIWKFVKPSLLREYDVDLLGLFLRIFTRFELRAVDRSVFFHLSLRPAPPAPHSLSHSRRRHRSASHRPARGCVYYLFCVLRDEHL